MTVPSSVGGSHADASAVASAIRCRSVTVEFSGGVRAVDGVDLDVPAGRIVSLIGPSGCGKTTLLRVMAGLQPTSGGTLSLDPGREASAGEVPESEVLESEVALCESDRVGRGRGADRGRIAFVFQQPALLPWRTALQNVMLPMELTRIGDAASRREAARSMLETVGLGDAAGQFPDQLSGGMRMRVSIARALVTEPTLLLLDEPFSALDDMLRTQLGQLFRDLWEARRFTAVMVTHNIGEAVLWSHQIVVMRDGGLAAPIENPLAEPRTDELRRTAEFARFYGEVSDALRGLR